MVKVGKIGLKIFKKVFYFLFYVFEPQKEFCCFSLGWNWDKRIQMKWKNHNFVDLTIAQILYISFSYVCLFVCKLLVAVAHRFISSGFPMPFDFLVFFTKYRLIYDDRLPEWVLYHFYVEYLNSILLAKCSCSKLLNYYIRASWHLNNYDRNFFNKLQMVEMNEMLLNCNEI